MAKRKIDGSRYILIVLLIIAFVLAFLIVKPFIVVILTSAILAYIFYPVHLWFKKKIKNNSISAWAISFLIILLIIIPTVFLFYQVTREAGIGYVRFQQYANSGFASCETGKICDILKSPHVQYQIKDSIEKITTYISDSAYDFIFSLPKHILNLLIIFFSMFFFLKDGPQMFKGMRKLSMLKTVYEDKIILQLKEVTRSVIYGFFVIAIIEAVIAGFAFWLAGLSSPILWASLVGILAFIPLIGPTIIWIPAVIIQIIFHEPLSALIIIVVGLIISAIDFFIKPRIIGKRAKVHPVVIFIGLLGGIAFFGLVGIILGPLILALLITFLRMYKEEN